MSFRLIISVLIVVGVWYVIEQGSIKGKKNYILYSLGTLYLVFILATIFGINPYNSWWSNYERMDGMITIGFLILYFWVIMQVFTTKAEWLWLLRASLAAAFLVAINGVMQINGVDNKWVTGGSNIRISATIGNAAFFASYLMFNLFFAGILVYLDKINWRRILYAGLGLFYLIMIYYSGTRGPIVGLIVSLFVMGGLYWFKSNNKQKGIISAVLLVIIFSGLFLYSARDSEWIKKYHAFDRIANISLTDATTYDRFLTWQTSWQSFLDRPILGYGPENYRYGFNKYYNPNIHEQWFDRAHNVILDYLNIGGAPGLLAYLMVLLATLYYFWQARKKDYLLSVLGIGLLTAYFIQNLFVFDTLNSYLPFILLLSFAAWLNFKDEEEADDWQVVNIFKVGKYFIVGVLVLIVWISANNSFIKPAKANLLAIKAYTRTVKNPEKALEYFSEALDMNTYGNREIMMQLSNFSSQIIKNKQAPVDFKKKLFDYTRQQMLSILEYSSEDIQFRLMLASLYQNYASIDSSYVEKSIKLLEPHIKDSPRRLELYYVVAQGYLMLNDTAKATELLEHAFSITTKHPGVYVNILNLYSRTGQQAEVLKLGREYYEKFELDANRLRQLAEFYFVVGFYQESGELLANEVIPAQPDNLQNYAALSSVYIALNDYDGAIDMLKQVLVSHPDWAEKIHSYIDQLEAERDAKAGEDIK